MFSMFDKPPVIDEKTLLTKTLTKDYTIINSTPQTPSKDIIIDLGDDPGEEVIVKQNFFERTYFNQKMPPDIFRHIAFYLPYAPDLIYLTSTTQSESHLKYLISQTIILPNFEKFQSSQLRACFATPIGFHSACIAQGVCAGIVIGALVIGIGAIGNIYSKLAMQICFPLGLGLSICVASYVATKSARSLNDSNLKSVATGAIAGSVMGMIVGMIVNGVYGEFTDNDKWIPAVIFFTPTVFGGVISLISHIVDHCANCLCPHSYANSMLVNFFNDNKKVIEELKNSENLLKIEMKKPMSEIISDERLFNFLYK